MRKLFWIFAALFYCVSLTAIAQQAAQPAAQSAPGQNGAVLSQRPAPGTAAAGGGTVRLDAVVTDKAGKPVAGLDQSDFTLIDNNQPAALTSFKAHPGATAASDPPVEVLIVFDLVNLPFNEVSYSRQQVANFLRQNGGHLAQPVAIYWLTDTGVKAQQAPVLDGDALAQAIESQAGEIRSLNRSAGANGAIERFEISLKMLTEIAESIKNTPGRKLVIWAGPGWPLLDNPNLNFTAKVQQNLFAQIVQLSTLLREARIELSSISQGMSVQGAFLYQSFLKGVKKPQQANLPNLGLKVLAVQSGGLVLPPTNDLAAALTTCVQDASAYYTLTFEAPPADGPNQYHELKLQVHKPGLTARTSTGYYDQP